MARWRRRTAGWFAQRRQGAQSGDTTFYELLNAGELERAEAIGAIRLTVDSVRAEAELAV